MPCELLAGPFNVSVPGAASGLVLDIGSGTWVDGVGIVTSAGGGGLYVMQPDGIAYLRGATGPWGMVLLNDLANESHIYGIDRFLGGMQRRSRISFGQIDGFFQTGIFISRHGMRLADRWISVDMNYIISRPLTGPDTWSNETRYPSGFLFDTFGITTFRPELGQVAVSSKTIEGTACAAIYDVNAKVFLPHIRYFPHVPRLVVYARELGVWLVVAEGTPNKIYVYADSVLPASLSNPIAVTPTKLGSMNRFRVRAIGAEGGPAAGEFIDWTCSAGELIDSQTTTDENGYAIARYVSPLSSGSITINAALVI